MLSSENLFESFKNRFGIKKFILFYAGVFVSLVVVFCGLFFWRHPLFYVLLFAILTILSRLKNDIEFALSDRVFDWFCRKIGSRLTMSIYILMFVVGAALISFFAFTGHGKSKPIVSDGKINVVVTTFPVYDLVRQVARKNDDDTELADRVNLKMLMMPGVDTHSYEPTPADIESIERCNLFIYIGGKDDLWVKSILDALDENKKNKIEIVNLMESLGLDCDDNRTDCHVWTSLKNSAEMAKAVADGLIKIDSKKTAHYSNNLNKYIDKVTNLKHRFEDVISNGKNRVLVFADKFPFKYFVEEFNLDYKTPFANCSAKTEPIALTVGKISTFVNENNIPVVLRTDYGNGEIAEMVSKETGAKVRVFHSCHTISNDDFLKGKTYLNYMEDNLKVLAEALG